MSTLILIEILLLGSGLAVGWIIFQRYRMAPLTLRIESPLAPTAYPKKILFFLIGLAVALTLKNAWNAFHIPLNWDESLHISSLVQMDLNHDMNLFRFSHHALSSVASILSMWIFGVSAETARLPSVFFSAITCCLLVSLCAQRFLPFTLFLILLHGMTNKVLGFNMFSQRAYPLMLTLAVCLYYLLVRFLEKPNGLSRKELFLFFLVSGLSFTTHLYSGFFVGVTIGYLGLLLALEGRNFSKRKILSGIQLIIAGAVWVIGFGATYPTQLKMLKEYGHALQQATPLPIILAHFVTIFGFTFRKHEWLCAAFFIFTIGVFFWLLKRKAFSPQQKILFFFPLYLCASFTFVTFVFKTDVIQRMFNWFYIPALIALSEVWAKVPSLYVKRAGQAALLFILCYLPTYHSGVPMGGNVPGNLNEFYRFMKEVKVLTAPIQNNCYQYLGEIYQSEIARSVYLSQSTTRDQKTCTKRYTLYFAAVPAGTPEDQIPFPELPNATPILFDKFRSRILFEMKDT